MPPTLSLTHWLLHLLGRWLLLLVTWCSELASHTSAMFSWNDRLNPNAERGTTTNPPASNSQACSGFSELRTGHDVESRMTLFSCFSSINAVRRCLPYRRLFVEPPPRFEIFYRWLKNRENLKRGHFFLRSEKCLYTEWARMIR